jgi:hypothetical protein
MAKRKQTKRGHKRTGRPVGHPPFVPTPTERRFVAAMVGVRMSWREICQVIGAGRGGDPDSDSGKPISKSTLFKHFKNELANGRAMLKARIMGKYYNALDDDAPWAIRLGMQIAFGWRGRRRAFNTEAPELERPPIKIVFVVPRGNEDADEPGGRERYGQKLLPRPRQQLIDVE